MDYPAWSIRIAAHSDSSMGDSPPERPRRDRFVKELKEAASLLATSGDGSPHPFVVSLARCTASSLGNATVDHTVTHLLFTVIVGRLDTRFEHKAKIVL